MVSFGSFCFPAKTGFSDSQLPAGTSGRLRPTSSPRPPGQPLAGKPIFRGLQASSTPGDDKSETHRVSPAPSGFGCVGGPSLRLAWGCWGEGGSQRKLPPRPPEPRARGRDPASAPGVGRALLPATARWGLGEAGSTAEGLRRAGGVPAREGARAGSGRPRGSLLLGIFRHFSVNGSYHCRPGTSLTPTGPTHTPLISTIFPEPLHSCRRLYLYHHRRRRYRLSSACAACPLPSQPPRRLRVHTLPPRPVASARERSWLAPAPRPPWAREALVCGCAG